MRSHKIMRIFGIDINLHFSWWIIFVLLSWSLSTAFFPHYFPNQNTLFYWSVGILSSILLFASVLFHEISHSLVAKLNQLRVENITLFFFGGIASLPSEDLKPKQEFFMAAAGPLFSLLLAGLLYLVYLFNSYIFLTAITFYLYRLNLILAIFNLMPGYPLDGGRMFRAILHAIFKDLKKATKIASVSGKVVASLLIFLGFLAIFGGAGNGLWFILLGGFLWFIAEVSYQQVVIKETLGGEKIKKLIDKKYPSLSPKKTLNDALKQSLKKDTLSFIIKKRSKFIGILDLNNVGPLKKPYQKIIVTSVMIPAQEIKTLKPKEDLYSALIKMEKQKINLLPILKKGKITGAVRKSKLSHYLMLKLEHGF